ncbi:SDR family oxidoreductase, partial [bacterium]|nr:SDR family oxidoreductase [bacterium]
RNHRVMNISRSECKLSSCCLKNVSLDIANMERDSLVNIFKDTKDINGIVFSQRFRMQRAAKKNKEFIEEYKTNVLATSNIIEAYREYQQERKCEKVGSIILVGSTYSKSIGLDQNWSYHACKYAQEALVNYYAVHSYGKFSINLVCPSTYIKEGSEEYWEGSRKNAIWNRYPVRKLATAKLMANNIVDILINSTLFNTGNKIMLDGGVSHIYHDQEI